MENTDFKYHKERVLEYIKEFFYYRNKLTENQRSDLLIDVQDLLIDLPVVKEKKQKVNKRGETFPEFKSIIEQTNRRLYNG